MRGKDTAGSRRDGSSAVAPMIGRGLRRDDVDSTEKRRTPATSATPGIRTSTTATRTTTTRTTPTGHAPSADGSDATAHAGLSFEALVEAYFDCRRTKRNTASALAFEADLERNLVGLFDELAGGGYRPGPSICFVVTRPRPREVWAAQFRDRIVHHLLYNRIGPRFERAFIADTCACIKGRGTLYAARRLEAKVRSVTGNWARPASYLKADIANFFVAIDKRVLAGQLEARIPEPWWLDLTMRVLFHDPRPNVILRATPVEMALVPAHKRLLEQLPHRGLPIGNLSSQFFANVYLDRLDQFAKHVLHCRHYIRYVDDFVILHEDRAWLAATHGEIETFLPHELGVHLNPAKTIIQPVDRGVDFVGQVVLPWRRFTRRRTFRGALRRTATAPADGLPQTANSYFGLLGQATACHRDRARLANILRRRGLAVDRELTRSFGLCS
ncbi:MAG: RNA-directed DNA polymerase [Phycisphaerales bacterium]|nr:RNA-directed DNA polymerase [Phycisphaerales bacterium]